MPAFQFNAHLYVFPAYRSVLLGLGEILSEANRGPPNESHISLISEDRATNLTRELGVHVRLGKNQRISNAFLNILDDNVTPQTSMRSAKFDIRVMASHERPLPSNIIF